MAKKIDLYDRSLKVMARLHPQIFFSLLMDNPDEKIKITVENPELNLPEKRSDYVWKVTDGREEGYFIFEFQLKASRKALKSAYIKCALLHEATDLPVIGVILYLRRGACRQEYTLNLCGSTNQYMFRIIRLWEYRQEIESGKRKELAPFLILMTDHPSEEVLRREKELIMQVEDENERADLLSIAMTLAFRHFQEEWVKEYFREEMQMIKTANIVQEWIDEGIQKGIKEGIQQGVQQGIEQGIEQGMQRGMQQGMQQATQQDILEILEDRFGLVPAEIVKSVEQINEVAALHTALRKAARVASLDEFREVLRVLAS